MKSNLEKCLEYLTDIEWRYQTYDNGPDGYICPSGCFNAVIYNNHNITTIHNEDCLHVLAMKTISKLVECENPHTILKEIL